MSRGFGSVQRAILDALEGVGEGEALLIGGGWSSGRRAAHRLAAQGELSLTYVQVGSRRLLAAQPIV